MQYIYKKVANKIIKIAHDIFDSQNNVRDIHYLNKIHKNSLLWNYGNVYSQLGQDGILSEIFKRLNIQKGTFVEFGAWDGVRISNSRYLFEKGWDGIFIEGDKKRYQLLKKNYSNIYNIKTINQFIGSPKNNISGKSLHQVLEEIEIDPKTISFVSIDIDGPDLEVALDLGFRPPVILLEGGSNFTPIIDKKIPNEISIKNIQQPFGYIFRKCKESDYDIVVFHQDSYLVRSDLSLNFQKFDSRSLYEDSFYFMTNEHRNSLLEFRKTSIIKKVEKDIFGDFKVSPLDYY